MSAIIAIRNKVDFSGSVVPEVPPSWTPSFEGSSYIRLDAPNNTFFCKMLIDGADINANQSSRALWAVFSINEMGRRKLKQFALSSSNAWTIKELRNDNGNVATRIKSIWKDERRVDVSGSVVSDHAGMEKVAIRETLWGLDFHLKAEQDNSINEIPEEEE